MRRLLITLGLTFFLVGCGSQQPNASPELCDLANRVDAVFDGVDGERQLTPDERATVESLVRQMTPLVPSELEQTFRLRYWPITQVGGDTSGNTTQAAYTHWRNFRSSC